ncbi:MAG: hypothetical protein U1F27_08495 [Turneriella sp.]
MLFEYDGARCFVATFSEQFDAERRAGVRRTALLVAFGSISFALVDPIFNPESLARLLVVRAGLAVLSLGIWGLTLIEFLCRSGLLKVYGYALAFFAAVGVALFTLFTGGSKSPYWAMELVVLFGTSFLLRFTLKEAAISGAVTLAIYDILMLVSGEAVFTISFIASNAGIALGAIVSAVAAGYMHSLLQKEFHARQSLAAANAELEKSVSELAFKKEQAEVKFLQDKLWLAHDLHDTVGSQLAQMSLLAGKTDPRSTVHLAELAKGTLESVRNFAHILKGEQRVDDLSAQLWKLEQSFRALGRYEVSYVAEEFPARVSDLALLHIDRILSEWTANVIRHSGADKVSFGTRSRNGRVCIWFYQNSGGFTWHGKAAQGGLRSIALRAQNIGAQVTVRRRGQGAYFMVILKAAS